MKSLRHRVISLLRFVFRKTKKYKQALKYVERAIRLSPSPQESWLKFVLSLYLRERNYKKARNILEQLVALYPLQKIYWKQLAGVYLHLKKNKKALITLELADSMGFLDTQNDYVALAGLLINEGIPLKGAQILESKIRIRRY